MSDFVLTPKEFRELIPEEVLLFAVIRQAFDDVGKDSWEAAQWFRGREYRVTCQTLGLSNATINRIRDAAAERYEKSNDYQKQFRQKRSNSKMGIYAS